jgi:hypothetical protein
VAAALALAGCRSGGASGTTTVVPALASTVDPPADISGLIADAKAIVVGTATGNVGSVETTSGRVPVAEIALTDVLRDDLLRTGERILISPPQGTTFSERGTYLFFLRPLESGKQAPIDQFEPVAGNTGIYPASGQPSQFAASAGAPATLPATIDVSSLAKTLGVTNQ